MKQRGDDEYSRARGRRQAIIKLSSITDPLCWHGNRDIEEVVIGRMSTSGWIE